MKRTRPEIQASEKYWADANAFVKKNSLDDPKNPSWFEITREMPERIDDWKAYFRWRLGYVTHGLTLLEDKKINVFFVPTERPEWFDGKWQKPGEAA